MLLPPLAASERRLARVASVSSWACAVAGLGCALAPRLLLRGLALGGFAPLAPGERLFAALAGGGLLGIAASLRRTAASPREQREGFAPLLWLLFAAAVFLFVSWRRGPALGLSAGPLGAAALAACALALGLFSLYFRAAPGVHLGAPVAPPAEAPAKAVQLGVRAAPAPLPAPAALAEEPGAAGKAASSS